MLAGAVGVEPTICELTARCLATWLRSNILLKLVGKVGIEPTRPCGRKILSLLCLPVSPYPRELVFGSRGKLTNPIQSAS